MKTYKNIDSFIKKQQKSINWEDEMKIGGKIFRIYEYGGGSLFNMDCDYVYFLNKRTRDAIYIKYICPSYQYIDGEKKQIKEYKFIDWEYQENIDLWRADTL